jgi:glycosyltransferase involved in cell wall biosynthesis
MRKILEVNVDDRGLGGVYGLVRNVIRNKPKDLQIDIACLETFENQKNIDELAGYGCHVHYVGYAGNKLVKQLKIYRNMKALIKKEQYDCVHIHADVANKLMVSGRAAKSAGVKKIILHSHATGVDGAHRKLKEMIHKRCTGKLPGIATDFATCSDLAAKWMFPKVPAEQVIRINNGIDLDRFRFSEEIRKQVRKELGIQDRFVIGHVGRFMYQKNHAYLIRVFAEVMKRRKEKKRPVLLLVGEGELQEEIRRQVQRAGLENDVIFFGLSPRVPELMQAMDVFVLPSHFEGLPIVGVEAQAAALPVIFSDQITREAKLTGPVAYLPITEQAVPRWAGLLERSDGIKRRDTYDRLTEEGYRIQDTVQTLLNLYKR